MLKGFYPPYTPSGKSSLLASPPWHYAGQVLTLAYEVDIDIAQTFIPKGLGVATGNAYAHVCEWQSTSDGWELEDPIYAQYKEYLVLIELKTESGEILNFCPLIWVDQDLAIARGILQGWPKKLGQVWMTRSYDLQHRAAAYPQAGTVIGASVACKDRRLADIKATLTEDEGERFGFLSNPVINLAGSPSVVDGTHEATFSLLQASVSDVVLGPMQSGTADLQYFEAPHDELAALAPIGKVKASLGQVAITISGATERKL